MRTTLDGRARWITLQGMPGLSTPFVVSIYCWFAWEVGCSYAIWSGVRAAWVRTVARG
jgi:hypothetical protein